VVEDLTAGLGVFVAAAAAAFPTVLMKYFKLVTVAQRFVQHLPLIECSVGLKRSRHNVL